MSLLIDVLTKSDPATSDTAQPEHSPTDAAEPAAEPELALAPEDEPQPDPPARADTPSAPQPHAIPAEVNPTEVKQLDATTVGIPPPENRLRRIMRSRRAQLGAAACVACSVASIFVADEFLQDVPLADDLGPATAIASANIEPLLGDEPTTASPADIGPPLEQHVEEQVVDRRVLVEPPEMPDVPAEPEFTETVADERIIVYKSHRDDPAFRHMRDAYDAFRAGDYTGAIDAYRRALEFDPTNEDALLGLAALALRTGDREQARLHYEATLDLDPQNSVAIAGLVALQQGGSPVDRESYLKNMLYDRPDAAHLYFSLGLQYANQARWSDAQQAFFDAFSNDTSNADYAFNLAVSLDRLGHASSAADYYRRSIELARGNHVIDMEAARSRLNALKSAAGDSTP